MTHTWIRRASWAVLAATLPAALVTGQAVERATVTVGAHGSAKPNTRPAEQPATARTVSGEAELRDQPDVGTVPTTLPTTSPATGPATAPAGTQPSARRPATGPVEPPLDVVAPPRPADPALLARLTEQLSDPVWKKREKAVSELIRLGDSAVATLERVAKTTTNDATRTAVQNALRQIAENKIVGTTYVTLHLKDVPPKRAFDTLGLQAGIKLKGFPDELWEQFANAKVSINVDNVPFWVAMSDLCRQTGLTLNEVNGQPRLVQGGPLPGASGKASTVAGPFLIVATQAMLNRTVNFEGDDPPVEEDFSMQLVAFPEPKLKVLRASQGLKLEEAVDDRGNSLLPETPDPNQADAEIVMPSGMGDGSYMLHTQLKRAKNPGARLTRMRASIIFKVQVESQTIEIKDVKAIKDVTKLVNGVRVVFNDLKKEQENWQLRVTVMADPNNAAIWDELQTTLAQRLKLSDAKGQVLESHGIGNSSSNNNQIEVTLMFAPSVRPEDGKQSGEPVKLSWEVATKTRDILVPFELKNLKLP